MSPGAGYHRAVSEMSAMRRERDPLTRGLDPATWAMLAAMPKAELHLHLDGALRPATALELARERGLDEGLGLSGMTARLVAPPRCRDQADLLRAFDLPIAILQDAEALRRVAGELVLDVVPDGTRYVEIRWAPALHTRRGLSLAQGVAAVAGGVEDAARSTGGRVHARLIVVAMRSHPPQDNVRVAEIAGAFAGRGVVAFDLAGPEAAFPDPLIHASAFAAARAAGLGTTVHAGEWGGAAQVRRALQLDPARIAHGAPAIDDPGLVRELVARGVTLDLCPTSNVQAAIVPSLAAHPLARLARAGVKVTLSTDDRTVSNVDLVQEYARAHLQLGLSIPELWRISLQALDSAFLRHDEALRARLRAEFAEAAAAQPQLLGSDPS